MVVVGRQCDELDTVTIHDRLGGALVARHFVENGHQEIGVVLSGETVAFVLNSPPPSIDELLKDVYVEETPCAS